MGGERTVVGGAAAVVAAVAARGWGRVVAAVAAPEEALAAALGGPMAVSRVATVSGSAVASGVAAATGREELVGNLTLLLTKSNETLFIHRKSIPNIGIVTSASRKRWLYTVLPNVRFFVANPQAGMRRPLALTNGGPEAGSGER
jgi:hypothetical protein